jgi:hypothetical protein
MRGNAMAVLRQPARIFVSEGLMPDAWTLTSTSPGPGRGEGSSPIRNTFAAGPVCSYQAAFMLKFIGIVLFTGHQSVYKINCIDIVRLSTFQEIVP